MFTVKIKYSVKDNNFLHIHATFPQDMSTKVVAILALVPFRAMTADCPPEVPFHAYLLEVQGICAHPPRPYECILKTFEGKSNNFQFSEKS